MFKIFCKVLNVFTYILLLTLIIVSIIFLLNIKYNPNEIKDIFGFIPMRVLTGSMQPEINPGDLILVRKKDINDIRVNDIVSFETNSNQIITHRVRNIIKSNTGPILITKGDANNVPDDGYVDKSSFLGGVVLIIPYGGYITNFTASWKGFILLFIIPIFLLIWGELKNILSDEKKIKKTSDNHGNMKTEVNLNNGKDGEVIDKMS